MTLAAAEFIRRFLLHVLPRGFHRIRYYGLLGNRHRTREARAVPPTSRHRACSIRTRTSRDHRLSRSLRGAHWRLASRVPVLSARPDDRRRVPRRRGAVVHAQARYIVMRSPTVVPTSPTRPSRRRLCVCRRPRRHRPFDPSRPAVSRPGLPPIAPSPRRRGAGASAVHRPDPAPMPQSPLDDPIPIGAHPSRGFVQPVFSPPARRRRLAPPGNVSRRAARLKTLCVLRRPSPVVPVSLPVFSDTD